MKRKSGSKRYLLKDTDNYENKQCASTEVKVVASELPRLIASALINLVSDNQKPNCDPSL